MIQRVAVPGFGPRGAEVPEIRLCGNVSASSKVQGTDGLSAEAFEVQNYNAVPRQTKPSYAVPHR